MFFFYDAKRFGAVSRGADGISFQFQVEFEGFMQIFFVLYE
jgi:hypothetical protein